MIASENAFEIIDILSRDMIRDEYGSEKQVGLIPVKTTKAKVIYKTGREKEINIQLTAVRVLKFKIRYDRSLDEKMVVRYYDEIYDIRSIEHHLRTDTYIVAERGKE